ncbi:RraA-like protein [Viridothelium virens]|uniref:RraA-like protein n=1 Tax=Viridothelium virens TaxID=1048519 RepID=A0A6A6HEM2_VIRVR|nr:RraA-like protein [Viridothelium virens]
MASKTAVKALESFTTCDVSDALLKLKIPHGGFLAGLTMWSPKRQEGPAKIIGPAYTVKYVRKNYDNEPKPPGHYIDTIPAGSVVFISCPPRMINAAYGGLMSTRAQYSGAVGTIVDGRVRDLQEHRDLNFPVFARDIGTASPYEQARVSEVNSPVRLQSEDQEAVINPGDYLIGDLNGVVCLPQGLAEKALELMKSQVEADEKIGADIKKGRTFTEASKEHRAGVKQP